ncbi:MAG: alpha-hydroxy acid oxidase [Pseudomonadota bacterium]
MSNRWLNIDDLRATARKRAHRMVFDYIDGGADDEAAMVNNGAAFGHYDIVHHVLRGVETIDTSIESLGHRLAVPFYCSPAAGQRLFHKDGERASARAAAHAGTAFSLSTLSSVSIEEIAALTDGPKFFQLYVWKDRGLVAEMLARARAAGYGALILTVDFPIAGNRERDPRNGFTIPPRYGPRQAWQALIRPAWTFDYLTSAPIRYANLDTATPATSLTEFVAAQLHAGFAWADAEWVLGEWNGPAILKGVAHTDDARRAVSSGFAAISLSNHGGRQLDASPAPIDLVENMRQTIGGDAEIHVDGGIRRGTDILKALALGADAVSFARPYLYGLAAAGEAGATRALDLMTAAIKRDMALAGIRSVNELRPDMIRRR